MARHLKMGSGTTLSPELITETDHILRDVLADVLGLNTERTAALDASSGLFGHLPELDSMAVAGLLTEIEDRLGIIVEDDEVGGDMLETYGALLAFVTAKRAYP
jgi:acyl carrier protein